MDISMQDLTLAEPTSASDGLLSKPKLRPTPQLYDKDPVTNARLYANDAELQAARELHAQEKVQHQADYKAWRAQEEKHRDRSGRQHASGAARRRAKPGPAQAQADNRGERTRTNYTRYVEEARAAAFAAGWGRGGCCILDSELARLDAERELLGELFVDDGQRVRVTASGYLHGRCGTVVSRAELCEVDAGLRVTSRPAANAAGRYELPEGRRHLVRLDVIDGSDDESETMLDADGSSDGGSSDGGGSGSDSSDGGLLIRLPPHEVEPWPRIGQRVLMHGAAEGERRVGLVQSYCSRWEYGLRADGTYGPNMRKHHGCYVCVTADGTCDHLPRPISIGVVGHCACASVLPPTMFEPVENHQSGRMLRNVAVAAAGAMVAAAVVAAGTVI